MVSSLTGNRVNWHNVAAESAEPLQVQVATSKNIETPTIDTVEHASAKTAAEPSSNQIALPQAKATGVSIASMAAAAPKAATAAAIPKTRPLSAEGLPAYFKELALSPAQQELATAAFNAVSADNSAKEALFAALESPEFAASADNVKSSFLAMCQLYPNDVAINSMHKLPSLKWFSALDGADAERATRMIGRLASEVWKGEVADYSAYNYATLSRLMNDEVKLVFSDNTPFVDTDNNSATVTVGRSRIAPGLEAIEDTTFLDMIVLKGLPINVSSIQLSADDQSGQNITNAITTLQNDAEFMGLERSLRLAYIDVVTSMDGSGVAKEELHKMVSKDSFKALPPELQKSFLAAVSGQVTSRTMDNMSRLLAAPWFKDASIEYRQNTLALFSRMGSAIQNSDFETQNALQYSMDRLLDGDLSINFDPQVVDISLSGTVLNIKNDLPSDSRVAQMQLVKMPILVASLDVLPPPQPASIEELQNSAPFKALPKINRNQILQNIKKSEEQEVLSGAILHLLSHKATSALKAGDKKALMAICAGADSNGIQNIISIFEEKTAPAAKETNLFLSAVATAKNKSATAIEMRNLLNAPAFAKAAPDVREALLTQCKNFPNDNSVKNLRHLTSATWFKNMEINDKQRAAKSIAYLAEVAITTPGSAQEAIINNTMARLLSDSIPLAFVDVDDDFGGITIGYAVPGQKGICINRALIPAGNGLFPKKNYYARRAALDTIPHEVSHQVNGDNNSPNYRYFQAEYRAWYVGYVAEHGKPPTNQLAFERCVDLINLYPNIHEALFDKAEERAKMVAFMNQMVGLKDPHPETRDELLSFLGKDVKNAKGESPIPDPELNHDMDN